MSAPDSTSIPLARHMAELLLQAPFPPTLKARRILEPSAGEGRLAEAVINVEKSQRVRDLIHLTLVENDTSHFSRLATLGNVLHQADFLKLPRSVLGVPFDRIIMAPPLVSVGGGTEADHVLRAVSMLAKGGRLVALVSQAYKTFSSESHTALREIVRSRPRKDHMRFMIEEDIRVGQFGMDRYGVVLVLDA